MKKNYLTLTKTLAALALITTTKLDAQVATLYSFSPVAGTYNAITTGTVLGNTSTDDQYFVDPASPLGNYTATGPGFDIGFSFMFNNHTYDRLAVCANGWISFGQSGSNPAVYMSGGTQGISYNSGGPAVLSDAVSGLSYDIQGQNGSSIMIATLGTAPTRTCVVQWAGFRKYGNTGDAFDFQIRLCETTNIVEIQFGGFVINSSGIQAQTGIRGDSNSDYSSLTTSSSNPWSNPAMATVNYATITGTSPSLLPTSGQLYRWSPPQCLGSLANLTATGNHSLVCPNGNVSLSLVNSYTVSGIVYTWAYGTNSSGPFTPIANSNGAVYVAQGVTTAGYYVNTATCLNGGASTATSSVFGIQVAATTVSAVPYYENFEGITSTNELPNCSWLASTTPSVVQTYTSSQNQNRSARSGNKFAAFATAYITSTAYFYTNGIQLNAGVTYSAAVWYKTEYYGYTNVTSFDILYGTAQNTTGLVSIAHEGPATSAIYKPLSNTFTVPTSGIYYIAIKASSNGSYGANYLSWDDLSITVPCDLNPSSVALSVSGQTICAGEELDLTASGADTYTWSTGVNGPTLVEYPTNATTYTLMGTVLLTGCTTTITQAIAVNPSPNVFVYALDAAICQGDHSTLLASGAATYSWNAGTTPNNANVVVSPTVTTTYMVTGFNSFNCANVQTLVVTVNPLPTVTATGDSPSNAICKGEAANITGSGALTFDFSSIYGLISGSPAHVSPLSTIVYTVIGTSALGCQGKTTYTLTVNECTGINEITNTLNGLNIYPNPTTGIFTIGLNGASAKTVVVSDLSGRIVLTTTSNDEKINVNLNAFANGIYYVKVQSDNGTKVTKLVKN